MMQRHRGVGIHFVQDLDNFADAGGAFGGGFGFGNQLGRRCFLVRRSRLRCLQCHAAIIARSLAFTDVQLESPSAEIASREGPTVGRRDPNPYGSLSIGSVPAMPPRWKR